MARLGNIHDISVTLGSESIDYPGTPAYRRDLVMTMPEQFCNLSHSDLAAVEPGRYTLFCLPLKIKGAEGAPVRAILIEG
jgi:kynurenine formamidase